MYNMDKRSYFGVHLISDIILLSNTSNFQIAQILTLRNVCIELFINESFCTKRAALNRRKQFTEVKCLSTSMLGFAIESVYNTKYHKWNEIT